MNFVDPKEYDIPGLVRKNRYKTILPSEYSLPLDVPSPTRRKTLTPGSQEGMESGDAQ